MADQCSATSAQANVKLESVTALLECEIERLQAILRDACRSTRTTMAEE
jgi:hypothetical protein